jgi:hypothetical protein
MDAPVGTVPCACPHECPDKSMLLAYTRHQKIEDPQKIRSHIEDCESCRQQCYEYERLNATLDVLASVQNSLSYSEPLAYRVFHVIHGGERQRSAKPTSRIPTLSIRKATAPIILLLALGALIVVTAVAALAFMHAGNKAPGGSTHQAGFGSKSSMPIVSHHNPMPGPKPTIAVPVSALSPTPIPDPKAGSTPYIALCSSPEDSAHSIMRICGQHFTPGHQVALLVKMPGSSQPKQLPAVVVNAQGNFQDAFIINNCKVPLAISALDLTSPASTNVLQNISFANCPVPPR